MSSDGVLSEGVQVRRGGASRRAASTPAVAFVLLSDEHLADLARAGNQKAFAAIFRRHHQALYRYCRGLLRSDEDSADALQNTFVQALRALPDEQRTIALKPWLYRVAHNEAISIIRQRRTTSELDEAAGMASATASEHADQRERLRELLSDLDELAERQRAALLMRELGGLGVNEIATALDTTVPAASQAIYDARKALNEFALGRAMRCAEVELAVSARDGRRLKSRPLRAHLRRCDSCRAFQTSITARRASYAQLAPDMPAAIAGSILAGVLGSGAAGAGVVVTVSATGVSVKLTALAAAAGLVGTGGYVALTEQPRLGDPPSSSSAGASPQSRAATGAGAGKPATGSPAVAASTGAVQAPFAGTAGGGSLTGTNATAGSSTAAGASWRRSPMRAEFGIGAQGVATPVEPAPATEPAGVAAPAAPAPAPAATSFGPLRPSPPAGMVTQPGDLPAASPAAGGGSKPAGGGRPNGGRSPSASNGSSSAGQSGGGQSSGSRPGGAGRGDGRPAAPATNPGGSGATATPNRNPGSSNGRGSGQGAGSSQGAQNQNQGAGSKPSAAKPNPGRGNGRGKGSGRAATPRATAPAPQVTTPAPATPAPEATLQAPAASTVPSDTGQPNDRGEGPATGAPNGHGHG